MLQGWRLPAQGSGRRRARRPRRRRRQPLREGTVAGSERSIDRPYRTQTSVICVVAVVVVTVTVMPAVVLIRSGVVLGRGGEIERRRVAERDRELNVGTGRDR